MEDITLLAVGKFPVLNPLPEKTMELPGVLQPRRGGFFSLPGHVLSGIPS